jgi:PAS domain S-box-containing protein
MDSGNPKSPVRILHLEDSERDAELVEAALTDAGIAHETVCVFSGADFARWVGKGGFDLILSDYTLPGFSGVEALALARERCPDVPFIYVSGTIGEERAVEALRNGATDYVLKDRPAKLGPAVRRALDEAQSKRTCTLALETLRRSEERFRRLVDSAADIIYTLTPEGNLDSPNPAFEKITGWPRADWLGRPVKDLVHPEDLPRLMEAFARALEGGETPPLEARFATRAGTYRHVESNITALVEGGRVTGAFGIARDITEFKTTQRMLEQAQKMEAVGRLAGGVAHDFNNILSVIISYSGFLLDALPQNGPLRADAIEVKKAGERAAALTRQLLAFSRSKAVEPREIIVNDTVRNLAKMLGRLVGEHSALGPRLGCASRTQQAGPRPVGARRRGGPARQGRDDPGGRRR